MTITTARHADLETFHALLKDQQAQKVDVIAPASKFHMHEGVLHVAGMEAELTEDGVTTVDGAYLPTQIFDEGVSDKLKIPLAYLRRMHEERVDLYDANVNGWLHGADIESGTADKRSFLLRLFRGSDGTAGIARAMLSNKFKIIDNFDILMAALKGIRQSGINAQVDTADLSERRMRVRIIAPEITALATNLLDGYRSPFERGVSRAGKDRDIVKRPALGLTQWHEPIVFAGLDLSNSETGGGAFTVTPVIVVARCLNGMIMTHDIQKAVHLGGKQEDGVIEWSARTQELSAELVTSKAADAIRQFLSATYVNAQVQRIEEKAGTEVAPAQIEVVTKELGFSKEEGDELLAHFVMAGQLTAGGVMNAVTSMAQTIADPDRAAEVEAQGLAALALVG